MFTTKDIYLLHDPYFIQLRKTESYYELQSISTKHCWIISKAQIPEHKPITIYHKHSLKTTYYHKHRHVNTISQALTQIKSHDHYVLHPEDYTFSRYELQKYSK